MTPLRTYRRALVLLLCLAVLAGCPQPPKLEVTPLSGTFGPNERFVDLTIANGGSGVVAWTIEEITRPTESAPWVSGDIPWLTPEALSGQTADLSRVRLTADRTGLPSGLINNVGVRISSGTDEIVVPLSLFIQPTLQVTPAERTLLPGASRSDFRILNNGDVSVSWNIRFLPDPGVTTNPQALPADFVLSTGTQGSTLPGASTQVNVEWEAGRTDFGLIVSSSAGSGVVAFRFGQVFSDFEVTPNPVVLYVDASLDAGSQQAKTKVMIKNIGTTDHSWVLLVNSPQSPGVTPPISLSQPSGSTAVGKTSEVDMFVSDATNILTGSGNYELQVTIPDSGAVLLIPIEIEPRALPVIAISEAPQQNTSRPEIIPLTLLDFGKDEVQLQFWIANIGPRTSDLYFRVSHEDEGVGNPVIVSATPAQGDVNGPEEIFFIPGENILVDAQPITVTINRENLTEDLTFRTITIEAVDPDFASVIEAVEPMTVQVRVERPPLGIEGAINRSRPPSVLRFVFLLRDTLTRVIPTMTAEQRDRISFSIAEDDKPLDLDETSQYVTGPENLRVNLVVMLDFTGSMYNAGTDDPENPLAPGEAVEQVKEATKSFLADLPPGYRVALMYYNKRQQLNRVLHSFTTDRDALNTALDEFSLPPAEFGQSNINDALIDAINVLAVEDAEDTLPFDEADVRSVVFITDGQDNASVASVSEVTDAARDARVRLYPLGYGDEINNTDLIVMATETGGHLYNAGNVRNLTLLLANNRGLTLQNGASNPAANRASFTLANSGTEILDWNAAITEGGPWISVNDVSPRQGLLGSGGTQNVTVRLHPDQVAPNTTVETLLTFTSDAGSGTARLIMDVGADNSVAQNIRVELNDEPGRIWAELQNQIVLTYITPSQVGGTYLISVRYTQDDNSVITGSFQEDGVFFNGTDIAGQLAMSTTGIVTDEAAATPEEEVKAEIYVRADYVPSGVSFFRTRFILTPSSGPGTPTGAVARFLADAKLKVELAPDGLLTSDNAFGARWSLLEEGDGIYVMLTTEDNPLPYGSFGNLLRLTVTGLKDYVALYDGAPVRPEFFVSMRVDNDAYVRPASPGHPSETKYFLYPGCLTNPERLLSVSTASDMASPARTVEELAFPAIDPEAPFAWDRDEDGIADFNDPFPDNEELPGPLTVNSPFEIELAVGDTNVPPGVIAVRNERLDTFAIESVTLDFGDDTPAWVTGISFGAGQSATPPAPLKPGDSATINLHIDVTGLPTDIYTGTMTLDTDLFGQEEVPITLVLNPAN